MTAPEMSKSFNLASSTINDWKKPSSRKNKLYKYLESSSSPLVNSISYYSGTVALNLYDSKESGDWHSSIAVKSIETGQSKSPFFIINNNSKLNTIEYLGLDGIVDYSKEIIEMGIENFNNIVLVAKPYRAIADMLLYTIINNRSSSFIEVDNWIPRRKEKLEIFRILGNARDKLSKVQKKQLTQMRADYGIN
ncbi:MAG: hypothetical protein HRT41_04925 [Campylobacteraceae bacterium]|nr:hypothetical protein [Campylobacteraceae bacterium]